MRTIGRTQRYERTWIRICFLDGRLLTVAWNEKLIFFIP